MGDMRLVLLVGYIRLEGKHFDSHSLKNYVIIRIIFKSPSS